MNSSPAFDPPGDAASGRYAVALLGDTHYDAEPESVYHSHYDESNRWAKIQHEEFRRNGEMWRARCRELLASSARLAHEQETLFVLQLGDIIQGDCDHVPTHKCRATATTPPRTRGCSRTASACCAPRFPRTCRS